LSRIKLTCEDICGK